MSGPAGETYDNTALEAAVVTVTTYGTYLFRWTETNGTCSDFDEIMVNFFEQSTAVADPDATVCYNATHQLAATATRPLRLSAVRRRLLRPVTDSS